jgi:hypothetical protein
MFSQSGNEEYSNFYFQNDFQDAGSCSGEAFLPGNAGELTSFNWVATESVVNTPNATVYLPGGVEAILCDKITRTDGPETQWLCAESRNDSSKGWTETFLRPVVHRIGSDTMHFLTFKVINPEEFPPTAVDFSPPSISKTSNTPAHATSHWQLTLGVSVAAFVCGIVLVLGVLRCRRQKQSDTVGHAYQAALLDVM